MAKPQISKTLNFKLIVNYCFRYNSGFYWIPPSLLYVYLTVSGFQTVIFHLSSKLSLSLLFTSVTRGFFLAQVSSWRILGPWPGHFCYRTEQWVTFYFLTSTSTKNSGTLFVSFKEIRFCELNMVLLKTYQIPKLFAN